MPRRREVPKRRINKDPRYGDWLVAKFINCIMYDGKKSVAQRVMYNALDEIQTRLAKMDDPDAPKESIEVFRMAVENAKPFVEVRSKRIGGANYQVPMQVNRKRQQALAFRWLINAARSERGREMHLRMADELIAAARKEGKAIQKREETHRMADANKAFAHFA